MALGTLARHGPRHGHEIRRLAEVTNVGEWGGVSVGALYRELRTMEAEGLVDAVRTEQVGQQQARTIYAITREGWLEFGMLREKAIKSIRWGPDKLGVALTFAGPGPDRAELAEWLAARRGMCAAAAAMLASERERLIAKGYLEPFAAAVMYRSQLHAETEVRWHDEFSRILADLPAEPVESAAPLARHVSGDDLAAGTPVGPPARPAPARPAPARPAPARPAPARPAPAGPAPQPSGQPRDTT